MSVRIDQKNRFKTRPPSQNIEYAYARKMHQLLAQLNKDIFTELPEQYKAELVQDDLRNIPSQIAGVFSSLATKWINRFTEQAEQWAIEFLEKSVLHNSQSMSNLIKRVNDRIFELNRRKRKKGEQEGFYMQNPLQFLSQHFKQQFIAYNVSLIKSIPEKHLKKVEKTVSQAFKSGYDMKKLRDALTDDFNVSKNRATKIAQSQSRILNAEMFLTGAIDAGFKQGIWRHSHGVKQPREDHLKADGKIFDLEDGCLISGEYVFPKQLYGCQCFFEVVIT